MSQTHFMPTDEQSRVISHDGSAFVSACPGSGKTRVLVERARLLLKGRTSGKAIAFLSFTNAAMSELDQRLRHECLLPSPAFPHFVGTFDSFLWRFFISPFGVPGFDVLPRLIPDKNEIMVRPAENLRELPLGCFDRETGEIIPSVAKSKGFDPAKSASQTRAYMTCAASTRKRFLHRGELDFDDVRTLVANYLKDPASSKRLAAALAGRFREVIVDEAQDCNPSDLEIIRWLRDAGIATKVVCDPHQSIYSFRGGVTEELIAFGQTFDKNNQLSMNGNFRSSGPICMAIVALRPKGTKFRPDRILGEHRSDTTPVHILAYPGRSVPLTVGAKFRELVEAEGIDLSSCRLLAATRQSGANAIGQPSEATAQDLTLRLAKAVTSFHFAFEKGGRKDALEEAHRVLLDIEGRKGGKTYHQFLIEEGIESGTWRPKVIKLVQELRYDPVTYSCPDAWHARAKAFLEPYLPDNSRSINQILRRNAGLSGALATAPDLGIPAKTIHSVKGMEFPAVCVVMTAATAKGILDYLETGGPSERSEDARKIYVAVSRAQRLLAIATPKSQAERLRQLLSAAGAAVTMLNL